VLGRLIAQAHAGNWGQSVIVETRPGASTMIGTASVAKAEPDGYTPDHRGEQPHHQSGAAAEDAVRLAEGFRADRAARAHPRRALFAPVLPAKDAKELIALGKAKTTRSTSARPAWAA
jgi:hypothetical protein